MTAPRQVPAATLWRVTKSTLGRMACVYADPDRDGHDHAGECLRDDEAYAAELVLGLVHAAVKGDDTAVLDQLTALTDGLKR